jgi:hypothetical protein
VEIFIKHNDLEKQDEIISYLYNDLLELGMMEFTLKKNNKNTFNQNKGLIKGDPISVTSIILTLVGAGGALSVSLGKYGLFSKIAAIIETYLKREIEISVKDKKGTVTKIKGPSKAIEKILYKSFSEDMED